VDAVAPVMDLHSRLAIDLSSPETRQDPYAAYARLRRDCPVYHNAARKVWTVSRYADIARALRDTEAFSSRAASFETVLAGADGHAHARVRRIVGRAFTTARVKELTGLVRSLAGDFVERIAARRECELIGDLALPLPLSVIAAMLSIDRGRFDDLGRWSAAIMRSGNPSLSKSDLVACKSLMQECKTFVDHHITQLASSPGDQYRAPFLTGSADKEELTFDEQVEVGMLLIVAGMETTVRLIGNSVLVLLQDPAWQDRLRSDLRLIPPFVEEVLRWESPVQRSLRVTSHPVEIAGERIPHGAMVELLIGSANRDPSKFADAHQFRIEREPNEHIAFGLGRHLCLGAQLARLEAAIALEALLQRFPEMVRCKPGEPIEFESTPALRGPARLNLIFPQRGA
jgi:pimeloyl-[acyl-carrier protein] synthase